MNLCWCGMTSQLEDVRPREDQSDSLAIFVFDVGFFTLVQQVQSPVLSKPRT